MKQDLTQLRHGFNARQPVTINLVQIHDSHIGAAPMQTVKVPIPSDSGGTQNYRDDPLWPPTELPIKNILNQLANQGGLNDCWALSAVFSIVEANYPVMRSRLVVLPNGNIGIYCFVNGDPKKPVTLECGYTLANVGSHLGSGHYVAMKAFELLMAFGRYMVEENGTVTSPNDKMADLNFGLMKEMYGLLGIPCRREAPPTVAKINSALGDGKAVTFGTPLDPPSKNYVPGHAYSVFLDPTAGATACNPWGMAGEPAQPMYIPIREEDVANYGGWITVADPSNALSVPAREVEITVYISGYPPSVDVFFILDSGEKILAVPGTENPFVGTSLVRMPVGSIIKELESYGVTIPVNPEIRISGNAIQGLIMNANGNIFSKGNGISLTPGSF